MTTAIELHRAANVLHVSEGTPNSDADQRAVAVQQRLQPRAAFRTPSSTTTTHRSEFQLLPRAIDTTSVNSAQRAHPARLHPCILQYRWLETIGGRALRPFVPVGGAACPEHLRSGPRPRPPLVHLLLYTYLFSSYAFTAVYACDCTFSRTTDTGGSLYCSSSQVEPEPNIQRSFTPSAVEVDLNRDYRTDRRPPAHAALP